MILLLLTQHKGIKNVREVTGELFPLQFYTILYLSFSEETYLGFSVQKCFQLSLDRAYIYL